MTVACFYGTRPQIIKASVLLDALRAHTSVVAVDTGQHYDWELNGALYEQLGVRRPDYFLEVGSGPHAKQTALLLTRCTEIIELVRPDAVAVIGDTNSTLGAALAAAQARVPIVHVEAGLRSGVLGMAEEMNRRVVDHISSVLCAPSRISADTLAQEHVIGTVVLSGDVARDVLERHVSQLDAIDVRRVLGIGPQESFVFATLHRAELTGDGKRLLAALKALDQLPIRTILAAHPRTSAAIGAARFVPRRSLAIVPPLGYLETLSCIREASAVVTDSGGIQREAYWLGTPCITVRTETEWPETVTAGANRLVPPDGAPILLSDALGAALICRSWDTNAYGDGSAADKIANATSSLVNCTN